MVIKKSLINRSFSKFRFFVLWAGIITVVISTCFVNGCSNTFFGVLGPKRLTKEEKRSKENLRGAIANFDKYATSYISQALKTIDEKSDSVKIKKTNLLIRVRLTQALNAMAEQDDSVVAFIETWALSRRITLFFQNGHGSDLYGDDQNIIVDAALKIQGKAENIGKEFLPEESYEKTAELVESFAHQNPIRGALSNLVLYAVESKPGTTSPFEEVVSLPMAPFTALKGVDRTADSIYSIHESVDRFSDIVENLPEYTRWQMLLLLFDMEEMEVVEQFMASLQDISDSSIKVATTIDTFPERVQQQTSIFVKEIDSNQENIQESLGKLTESAQALRVLTSDWTIAANATDQAMLTIKHYAEINAQKPEDQRTSIKDYAEVAQKVTEAADKINDLVGKLTELSETKKFNLLDQMFFKALILILAVFVFAVFYKLITRRWATK
jgi:hypothetical protein